MQFLYFFSDPKYSTSVLFGLSSDWRNELQQINDESTDLSYQVCALYRTNINDIEIISRLVGQTFHAVSDYYYGRGVKRVFVSKEKIISWMNDITALTGTRHFFHEVSEDESLNLFLYPSDYENDTTNFAAEVETNRPLSDAHDSKAIEDKPSDTFVLTLRQLKSKNFSNEVTHSQINAINKETVKEFLNSKGYKLSESNFLFSESKYPEVEYTVLAPVSIFKQDWVLALDDPIRRKLFLFKVPACDISYYEFQLVSKDPFTVLISFRAGNPNFPTGKNNIEFRKYAQATYEYDEILNTEIPKDNDPLTPVSLSLLSNKMEVDDWFGAACDVLDILSNAKPLTFSRCLRQCVDEGDFSVIEVESENNFEMYYISNAKVWIRIPSTTKEIISFLKQLFIKLQVPTNLLSFEFCGENPFADDENDDSDESEMEFEQSLEDDEDEDDTDSEAQSEATLSELTNMTRKKPVYFMFQGNKSYMNSWNDLLRMVLEKIEDINPEGLRNLASQNINPTSGSGAYLTLDKEEIKGTRKIEHLSKSGAYFVTGLPANYVVSFLIYVLKHLEMNPDDLLICYRKISHKKGNGRKIDYIVDDPDW